MKTNIHSRWALGALFFTAVGFSSIANAALVGRLATTPGGTDYQAYYDTNANLTWLADANYAKTTGYSKTGFLTWNDANTWLRGLNIAGVTGWHFPVTNNPHSLGRGSVGPVAHCTGPYLHGDYMDLGYNCTHTDMSNLFYNVLGGVAKKSISTTHNANYHLFSNIQEDSFYMYWSSGRGNNTGYDFGFNNGFMGYDFRNEFVWPVYSGDVKPPAPLVSAVPVPAAIWLFGSGLVGFIGLAKRKMRTLAA